MAAGPAWLLLVVGTSGLLASDLLPTSAANTGRSGAVALAAAPAAHGLRIDGGEREASVLPSLAQVRTPTAMLARPTSSPGWVDPPLTDYVLLSPDPHDAIITGATASPSYQHDYTIFAWGWLIYCASCVDEALYRSRDGGHIWTLRAGVGYTGGQILLPFDYDTTHVVFALVNGGLWRSDDDGNVFTLALPLQVDGGVAVLPGANGDSVVVIGGQPPMRYDERTRLMSLGPRYPTITDTTELAYAGSRLLVHGYRYTTAQYAGIDSSPPAQYLLSCDPGGTSCDTMSLPRYGSIVVSPAYQRDHAVAFITGAQQPSVQLSTDGGRTFTSVAIPAQPPGAWTNIWPYLDSAGSLAFAVESGWVGDDGRYRTAMDNVSPRGAASPFGSVVMGPAGIGSVISLPDGTLLALRNSIDSTGKAGFLCSHDAGVTWAAYC